MIVAMSDGRCDVSADLRIRVARVARGSGIHD
jgi:hypothetical protein